MLDRVEGEAIITRDTNATICMMSLGPGLGWDAYICPELKVCGGHRYFGGTAAICVAIFIEMGNFR